MFKTLSLTRLKSHQISSSDHASSLRQRYRCSPAATTSGVDASYEAGVITISGVVPTYYAHQIALAIAQKQVANLPIVIRDRIRVLRTT